MLLLAMLLTAPATPTGTTRVQNEAAAAALHRRLDANHDGYVTYAEILAVTQAMIIPKGQPPIALPDNRVARAAFDQADTNHDGRLSAAEERVGADRSFDAADTNHDGILSADERGADAARSLAAMQRAMTTWTPMPCRPGAACDTARRAERGAPAVTDYTVPPAERLEQLDLFRGSLSAADRARLDTALPRSPGDGIAQCDQAEGSRASCEAAAYLPALRATDLMARFERFRDDHPVRN